MFQHQAVAVKMLKGVASAADVRLFQHEALVQASLEHDNIVHVLGSASDTRDPTMPKHALVVARLHTDLLKVLCRSARGDFGDVRATLPLPWRINAILQLARGLAYLHSHRIAHADIKPANVLLTHPATGCVLQYSDFGLAQEAGTTLGSVARTRGGGMAGGTIVYMAPELLQAPPQGKRPARSSFRSDVYAWAIMCWQVLCLQPNPFPGYNDSQVQQGVIAGMRPDGCHAAPAEAPAALLALLRRAWAGRPSDRPARGGDLLAALQAALPGALQAPQPLPPALRGDVCSACRGSIRACPCPEASGLQVGGLHVA